MNFKVKKQGVFSAKKEAYELDIKETRIRAIPGSKEDLVEVCFRGRNISGIVELTKSEVMKLFGATKRRRM